MPEQKRNAAGPRGSDCTIGHVVWLALETWCGQTAVFSDPHVRPAVQKL